MTDHVSIDYETFSLAPLKKVGLWAYARHPSTRILCVAWAWNNDEPQVWWPGRAVGGSAGPGALPESLQKAFRTALLDAFNANFERAITTCVAAKLGFHVPALEQWRCTQAVARMCGLPDSLDLLTKVLNTRHKKDADGKRLINLFSVPQRQHGRGAKDKPPLVILPKDRPEDFHKFVRYCADDVRAERSAKLAMPLQELPPFEQKVWQVDSIVNERGVKIHRPMAKGAVKVIAAAKVGAGKRLAAATGGAITTAGQRARFMVFAKGCGYKLANMQKHTVRTALEDVKLPPKLRTVLELRDDSNISSVAKYTAMLLSADLEDDRVRDAHAYHRASPGRWGGRVVQTQNIPRPVLSLDDWDRKKITEGDVEALELVHGAGRALHVLRDAIRNCIIADKGHEFFVCDKASIEARVLGWVADCKTYMEAFRTGKDLYVLTAGAIYDRPYDTILAGYKAEKHTETEQRKTGKDSVLGQGYGMGHVKFKQQCWEKGGRRIPMSLARRATTAFRTLHHEIPKLWRSTERAAQECVRTGKDTYCGHRNMIQFRMLKGYLTIRLPSGRRLWYPQARIKMKLDKWERMRPEIRFMTTIKSKLWLPESTYGGKLVENIVQAIARDLLAIALVKCERMGLRPVMHVHDEIVNEVRCNSGRSLDEVHAVFRTVPKWGDGLLLGSGGFVTRYYRK